ncbi:MAG: YggS family pyridoxal phosphate-dependent enzyme, partial [Pseudomonadota bacterium]
LETSAWEDGAAHANLMAQRLAAGVAARSPFTLAHPVEANAVFVRMPPAAHQRLNDARDAGMPPLQVCIQVNISGEHSKSGILPDEVAELARAVQALPRLRLRGLMVIPAPSADHAFLHGQFADVRTIYQKLNAQGFALDTLSMGMSDDFAIAIAEGATIVRIGSAIFGARSKPATGSTLPDQPQQSKATTA